MTVVTINEFQSASIQQGGVVPIAAGAQTDQTAITSSGTAQQSAVFGINTKVVVVSAYGGSVRLAFGSNPTATANSLLLSDGQSREYAPIGGVDKVSIINA